MLFGECSLFRYFFQAIVVPSDNADSFKDISSFLHYKSVKLHMVSSPTR